MNHLILEVNQISKSFPGVKALDSVNLKVEAGEIHAIVGENGAGKSTLMNILSGVYTPDTGSIHFDGREVKFKDPRHAQKLGIAMIHQELSLAGSLSVAENVFLGRLNRNKFGFIQTAKINDHCKNELECLGIQDIRPTDLVKDLSVSQMQMVEIAKALSYNAKLIIMDEPTSSLTNRETEMLLATIRSLKKRGISILYISHRMDEIFEISDQITVLRDGCYIKTLQTDETDIKELVSLMVGRVFNKMFEREHKKISENDLPVLEVENLCFKNKVNDVSLKIYPGEIVALTGLVGAGRSEVIQSIFGLYGTVQGKISIDGKRVAIKSPQRAIQLGLGLVPEGRKTQGLFLNMRVRENISIANLNHARKGLFISNRDENKNVNDYIQMLKVKTSSPEQQVKYLSGGNQQKTIIARWLLNNPKILFLDEPTHGVDIGAKTEIYEIISKLAANGVAVLLISSELPEVLTLADRILVMHNGKITGEIDQEHADQETIMAFATNQAI